MGRHHYVPLRRHREIPIRLCNNVPLRRPDDVPPVRRWFFHMRGICDVNGT